MLTVHYLIRDAIKLSENNHLTATSKVETSTPMIMQKSNIVTPFVLQKTSAVATPVAEAAPIVAVSEAVTKVAPAKK